MVAVIRGRREGDLEPAASLLVAVHESDGYPVEGVADPRSWLLPELLRHAWVADDARRVVGHVALTSPGPGDGAAELLRSRNGVPSPEIAVLGRLFVDRQTRGGAVGERLVRTVMQHAQEDHLALTLDVMEKDQAAIRLYERLGWSLLGTTTHRFGQAGEITARCYVAPE